MVIQGHVENGKIVLDEEATLAEGMKVRVELLAAESTKGEGQDTSPTLYERLKPIIGVVGDLHPNASENVDEHLYGK